MSWRRYLIRRRSAASFTRTSRTVVRAGLQRLSLPSARANPSLPKNHVRRPPMRVNIRKPSNLFPPLWGFVRVYGRATPDRAGARPYHGIDLIPYVDAHGRPPDRGDACFKISETKQTVLQLY